jgi:hypothetical protein
MESDKSKDCNENEDKYVVVHDQSSEMICSEDIDMETEDMSRPAEAIAIETNDENTGYVINTADLEGTPINDVVTMATQPSQTSHTTTLTDIDEYGNKREINVTILEAPEGGFQVVDLSAPKKKKEQHMTYNLEMLSDVAITLPGGANEEESS